MVRENPELFKVRDFSLVKVCPQLKQRANGNSLSGIYLLARFLSRGIYLNLHTTLNNSCGSERILPKLVPLYNLKEIPYRILEEDLQLIKYYLLLNEMI